LTGSAHRYCLTQILMQLLIGISIRRSLRGQWGGGGERLALAASWWRVEARACPRRGDRKPLHHSLLGGCCDPDRTGRLTQTAQPPRTMNLWFKRELGSRLSPRAASSRGRGLGACMAGGPLLRGWGPAGWCRAVQQPCDDPLLSVRRLGAPAPRDRAHAAERFLQLLFAITSRVWRSRFKVARLSVIIPDCWLLLRRPRLGGVSPPCSGFGVSHSCKGRRHQKTPARQDADPELMFGKRRCRPA